VAFPVRYGSASKDRRNRTPLIHTCCARTGTSVRYCSFFVSVLAICSFLGTAPDAEGQLWEVPPLPQVKYSQVADGITATVGNDSLHISVCRAGIVHFVATPDPPNSVKPNRPWMLDAKDSCPGAKFELTQGTDTVLLTTDVRKVALSLKWGSVQYSTIASDSLLRERNSIPRTYDSADLNG